MAMYSYSGRNKTGKLVKGNMDAGTADGVASQLLGNGVTPISIKEKPQAVSFKMPELFKTKVKLDELIMFCRQMYSLTRSGVVLNKAIRGLADSVTNPRLQEVLREVEVTLNSGVELASALNRHRDVFDDLFISIVRVGENSGRLDLAFQQMAQYLELDKDTRRRVSSAVRYPMFVIIAISAAMVVLNIWVIPVFADLFSQFGADLPWATKILIGTSTFFVEQWPWLLVGLITLVLGLRYYVNTEKGEMRWDKIKLKIPVIGSIIERSMLARYSRSFSLMLKSGVPLIQALELCSKAVGNAYMAQKIRGMRDGIQRGDSLLRTSANTQMFTPLVLQMVQVGEETGKVDDLLEEMALFYEQEVDYDLKNLSSYIEPILIVAIAGLVMILALGIFLPMWDMMSVMQ